MARLGGKTDNEIKKNTRLQFFPYVLQDFPQLLGFLRSSPYVLFTVENFLSALKAFEVTTKMKKVQTGPVSNSLFDLLSIEFIQTLLKRFERNLQMFPMFTFNSKLFANALDFFLEV